MGTLIDKALALTRLEFLKGSRTQYTIITGLVINALVSLHFITLSPEDLDTVNKFLALLGGYFFAEKVSTK